MAVYTEVSDTELEAFLTGYDLGQLVALKGIAEGIENSNYLMRTTTGEYILTLYEKRVRESDLPYFLGLLDHLAGHGIPCPLPIHDHTGSAIGRLCDRPAAIVTFVEGVSTRRPNRNQCAKLGGAMARLHRAGMDYPAQRANSLALADWRPLLDSLRDRADLVEPGLGAFLEAELTDIEAQWPDALPTGVIHADLFPDNLFFLNGDVSGVIDFYFACTGSFAYEIGICLNAWCFDADNSFNVTLARDMMAGYAKVRPLEPAEMDALPLMARGSAMRFALTRLYDWLNAPEGAAGRKKNPMEYIQKLRFHTSVKSAAAYGLTF